MLRASWFKRAVRVKQTLLTSCSVVGVVTVSFCMRFLLLVSFMRW